MAQKDPAIKTTTNIARNTTKNKSATLLASIGYQLF